MKLSRNYVFASLLFAGAIASADLVIKSVSDIVSMQVRADGTYDVVCRDGSFENVGSQDIVANNVCPYVPAPAIQDGAYSDQGGQLCDQRLTAAFEGQSLISIRLDYPGCTGDYLEAQCSEDVCVGTSSDQEIHVRIVDSTHYHWDNMTYPDSQGDFARIGDLTVPLSGSSRPSSHTGHPVAGMK